MSGAGAPVLKIDATGLTVEIVASQWHIEVMQGLVAGAIRAAEAAGAEYRLTRVPGAFELTVVAEQLARNGADSDRLPRSGDSRARRLTSSMCATRSRADSRTCLAITQCRSALVF